MSSADCDYSEHDMNFDYVILVNKQITKYERIFTENERNFNRYSDQTVGQLITITDNGHHYHKPKEVDTENPKTVEKLRQLSTDCSKDVYSSQYKMKLSLRRQMVHSKPTKIRFSSYVCKWDMCSFETLKYCSIIKHLLNKHMDCKLFRNYRRIFLELNKYRYKCAIVSCDYETIDLDSITKHVNTDHKQWLCSDGNCSKSFLTRDELILHSKHHLCGFNLKDKEYLNGNGVCSLVNIKKYFKRRKVIDGSKRDKLYHRYLCQWSECCFRTYQYNAIQEHVHNRHTCPHINKEEKGGDKEVKQRKRRKKIVQK